MILSQSFVRSLSLIAVFAAAAVASVEETLPTPRSIIFTAGQEQAAEQIERAVPADAAAGARYDSASMGQLDSEKDRKTSSKK
jgi:predicted RNA-binding protein with PIN domain